MTVQRIVVVGAGECGARAVAALRAHGFEGSITMIGDERLAPYERPPLSKATLVDADEPRPVSVVPELRDLTVDFVAGQPVTAIDRSAREVVLGDDSRVRYDRLLLATGASARRLPVDGGDAAFTLRTFDDCVALRARLTARRRIVIIGAGFIGLELAAAARQRGCDVTVVEVGPRPLGRVVPPQVADEIAKRHLDEGVEMLCGVHVDRIEPTDEGAHVVVRELAHPLDADVVVAGVGAAPNVALAKAAGLAIDNGIAVDATLQTSDPAIYAAGDCCSFPHARFGGARIRLESWRNALDQGAHVAPNLLGADEAYTTVPWFWSDQYDLGLQIAGLPTFAVTEVVRERPDGTAIRFGLDADGTLVSATGVARGTGVAKDVRAGELLIDAGARPDPTDLADPDVALKALLKHAKRAAEVVAR